MQQQGKSLVYFDTSVISKMRTKAGVPIELAHLQLLKEVLDQYHLSFSQAVITDKLFVEVVGHGDIRKNVLDKEKADIRTKKQALKEKIQSSQSLSPEEINEFVDFLQNLFSEKFPAFFSQKDSYSITAINLKEYPFNQEFNPLRQKVIRYAKQLFKNDQKYNCFISTLVTDSIIRFALDFINLRELPPDTRKYALDSLQQMLNALLLKFVSQGIVGNNLVLVMSGLRSHSRAEHYFKYGTNPVGEGQILRLEDDFADSDMPYLALHGESINGVRLPVTVITNERPDRVQERLKFHLSGLNAIIANKPKWLEMMSWNPLEILLGRTVCIDFENRSYTDIPSSNFFAL